MDREAGYRGRPRARALPQSRRLRGLQSHRAAIGDHLQSTIKQRPLRRSRILGRSSGLGSSHSDCRSPVYRARSQALVRDLLDSVATSTSAVQSRVMGRPYPRVGPGQPRTGASNPPHPGSWITAPLPQHWPERAERRSMSLEASGPHARAPYLKGLDLASKRERQGFRPDRLQSTKKQTTHTATNPAPPNSPYFSLMA